ncbi:MAG: glycosyltransferase [Cyanobacteria bacterium P01_A01_bin.123]
MKLAYIAQSTVPSRSADSIHVMKMCQAFHGNGHDVHLLLPNKYCDREIEVKNSFDYYNVEPCFTISYFPWLAIKGRAYFYGWSVARRAKNLKPDLVYGRDIIGCYFASTNRLPVIFESHTPIAQSGKIATWLFNHLIKQPTFQYLVVITQSLKQWYLDHYNVLQGKIVVAADGADLPEGALEDHLSPLPNQKQSRFRVAYIGHLYPGKGMEVISKLVMLCPDIEFHIVGDPEKDVAYWSHYLRKHENVIFHGYRPHSAIHNIMRQMDILISPNLKRIELPGKNAHDIGRWTSPLKIFEYMAARKPIVASDVEVLREVLENERNALLCNPDDLEAWKIALYRLKSSSSLSRKLSQNAYKDLSSKYTWKVRGRRVLSQQNLVDSCLSRSTH